MSSSQPHQTPISVEHMFNREHSLVFPYLPDADAFLHAHRLSTTTLKLVEANHSDVLFRFHLPNLIESVRSRILDIAATQPNARQFYTRLYLRIQMATQHMFDPLGQHGAHFSVTMVATASDHQPYSFRALPLLIQQLLVEMCVEPSSRSPGLDSVIQCYDLATFLGLSTSSSPSLHFQSVVDTSLSYPFPYCGDPAWSHMNPPDWAMAQMREEANANFKAGITDLKALFPWCYLESLVDVDFEMIPHADSCSGYHADALPDDWFFYLIDLMRDRVLWIGATNRGELIGIVRQDFDKLNTCRSVASTQCTCQTSCTSSFNGPIIAWRWSFDAARFFTTSLLEFLQFDVKNDYVIRDGHPEHDHRGYRPSMIARVKQTDMFKAWSKQVQQMDSLIPLLVSHANPPVDDVKSAIDRMIAEVTFTTVNAYIDGYGFTE